MADEKKPKIDLKARLGKNAAGAATPPPPATGAIPIPTPGAMPSPLGSTPGSAVGAAIPAPASSAGAGGLAPPGIPVGPPPAFKSSPFTSDAVNVDPSNPLAAAMAQPAPVRSIPSAPPPPQRIEVDELTIQEARKGARKQGLIAGVVFGLVLGAVGFIAGGAQETNKGRAQSVAHAKELSTDVAKSREQLKALADKLETGRNTLGRDKKFPDSLVGDLSGINVDFDGAKLAGIRFSGFNTDTTRGLIEYISGVQQANDRKGAIVGLLTRLQKPLTEQLASAASGKPPAVNFVVLIEQDSAKNPFAILAPLQKPLDPSAPWPAELTATNPLTKTNVKPPKLASIDKGGAAYVIPKSLDAAFPSETSGQIGQLVSQLSRVITDIRGEATAGEALDAKPGLLERADKLVANLNKVQ